MNMMQPVFLLQLLCPSSDTPSGKTGLMQVSWLGTQMPLSPSRKLLHRQCSQWYPKPTRPLQWRDRAGFAPASLLAPAPQENAMRGENMKQIDRFSIPPPEHFCQYYSILGVPVSRLCKQNRNVPLPHCYFPNPPILALVLSSPRICWISHTSGDWARPISAILMTVLTWPTCPLYSSGCFLKSFGFAA